MRKIFFILALTFAQVIISSSCKKHTSADRREILITVPATVERDTRTVYDDGRQLALWQSGDEIAVTTYYHDSNDNTYREVTDGYFRKFTMTSDSNGEYAKFQGYVPQEPDAATHYLHAFYPFNAIKSPATGEVNLPATQFPSLVSFDGNAAFMSSAPLAIDAGAGNNLEVDPFRFRHISGFLRLKFGEIPEGMADEIITKVEICGDEGASMAGLFRYSINSGDLGESYTLTPVNTSNTITLNYHSMNIKWSDLTECWFAINPGEFNNLRITVTSLSGKVINYAPRNGLIIKDGVIKPVTLNFKAGDSVGQLVERTLTINCDALGLTGTASSSSNISLPLNDAKGSYVNIKYIFIAKSNSAIKIGNAVNQNSTAGYANIYNTEPIGYNIKSVTLNCSNALTCRKFSAGFGTDCDKNLFELYQTGVDATTVITPADNSVNYKYFGVRGSKGALIESITITYEELAES